jgi:predicted transcriptional regulator
VVSALISKEEAQLSELDELMEKKFEGSLPAFIAAFAKRQALSEKDIQELERIIGEG